MGSHLLAPRQLTLPQSCLHRGVATHGNTRGGVLSDAANMLHTW